MEVLGKWLRPVSAMSLSGPEVFVLFHMRVCVCVCDTMWRDVT